MILPRFLLCTNKAELSGHVIISTERPFPAAIVLAFTDADEFAMTMANNEWLTFTVVENYQIVIAFNGNLDGYVEIGDLDRWKQQTEKTLDDMKRFFIDEQIERKRGLYRKYLRP